MNTPSTLGGNWEWRATADQITGKLAKKLYKYMEMYGRVRKDPKALEEAALEETALEETALEKIESKEKTDEKVSAKKK